MKDGIIFVAGIYGVGKSNLFIAYRINKLRFNIPRHRERQPPVGFNRRLYEFLLYRSGVWAHGKTVRSTLKKEFS